MAKSLRTPEVSFQERGGHFPVQWDVWELVPQSLMCRVFLYWAGQARMTKAARDKEEKKKSMGPGAYQSYQLRYILPIKDSRPDSYITASVPTKYKLFDMNHCRMYHKPEQATLCVDNCFNARQLFRTRTGAMPMTWRLSMPFNPVNTWGQTNTCLVSFFIRS
ncbi:hypothetical protein BDZ91DRAFT_764570 [Kalaharituber pfeilii]|nr:hypothetical protein BDZ91DRAFT_764570 [Kalaharituber pfeilii]